MNITLPDTPEAPGAAETPNTPETPAACILNSDCPKGSFCRTQLGEEALCLLGSVDKHGNPVATVISWKVTQDGLKKLAVEWEGLDSKEEKFLAEEERVGAPEWLNGNGFNLEAEVLGPGAGEGFEAWAVRLEDGNRVEGSCTVEALSAERAKWTCHMEQGYIGRYMRYGYLEHRILEGPFEVYVQAGENPQTAGAREAARKRSYQADVLPPMDFQIVKRGRVALGETFSLCPDEATDSGSGLKSAELSLASIGGVENFQRENVSLSQTNLTPYGPCTDIYLPLDLEFSYSETTIRIMVGYWLIDNVGNTFAPGAGRDFRSVEYPVENAQGD